MRGHYYFGMVMLLFGMMIVGAVIADSGNLTNPTVLSPNDNTQTQPDTIKGCLVYFTGIGCPHCAKSDPYIFEEYLKTHPDVVVIEYEIYRTPGNARIGLAYADKYKSRTGIPHVYLPNTEILGDLPILKNLVGTVDAIPEEQKDVCLTLDGLVKYDELDFNQLPGIPKIWRDNRILIREEDGTTPVDSYVLKELLSTSSCGVKEILEDNNIEYEIIHPEPVALSGREVKFDNAIRLNGWVFQWNGEGIYPGDTNTNSSGTGTNGNSSGSDTSELPYTNEKLTVAKVVGLAAVDAVNPCALAVLTLMLIAILTYNPTDKRKVLLAGLAFTVAVYVMYMFYGLVIIRFFQIIQVLTSIRLTLYKILGGLAVILGILNIKDYLWYKPGGLGTEMPLSLRPTVKKIISGVTSPSGAFVVGLFVTVFLLPCTMGPYVIAGGLLSAFELLKTIPWLLLYNAIFVLPMVAITIIVYLGMVQVEDVGEWKDKNIRKLHLIAGIIMLFIGIGMVLGWF